MVGRDAGAVFYLRPARDAGGFAVYRFAVYRFAEGGEEGEFADGE